MKAAGWALGSERMELNGKASLETFLWAICVGMGFRIGWGLIGLLIDLAAKAVAH